MASSHPLDSSRTCPACGQLAELRYDATQVLHDGVQIVRAHQVTCRLCAGTSTVDPEPMPGATDADLLTVLERRLGLAIATKADWSAWARGELA